VKTDKKGMKQL